MEALLLKLTEQLNGAVFVLVAVLILFIWGVWKLSQVVTLFGGYKDERKEVKNDIREIKTDIAKIDGTVQIMFQRYQGTVQSQSPLSLTEKGIKISQELNMEQKLANNWEAIRKRVEEKSPCNPYDIQTISMNIARDCFDTILSQNERDEIKLYAYKTGMNLLEIIPIIGIKIRDRYIDEKGIKVDEIDKHAPS